MAAANNSLTFHDLLQGCFELDAASGMYNLRLIAVGGSGTSPKNLTDGQKRDLIGVDGSGCLALRYVAVAANTCTQAAGCGVSTTVEDLFNGSVEMGADGLIALRIKV